MIISALDLYYQRLQQSPDSYIPPIGYSIENISFALILSPEGDLVDITNLQDTSERTPRPKPMMVPMLPTRASNIAPFFLWDKSSYVLGLSNKESTRPPKEHQMFIDLHEFLLKDAQHPSLQAFLKFLRKWEPGQWQEANLPSEVLDKNLIFRIDNVREYLHEIEEAADIHRSVSMEGYNGLWKALAKTTEDRELTEALKKSKPAIETCLSSGNYAPISRLHPSIGGVKGAHPTGAHIISFNRPSFRSYGKDKGLNAPVSETTAFRYTTALNYLLRRDKDNHQRIQLGDATTVFWAIADTHEHAEAAETTLGQLLDPRPNDLSETDRLRTALEEVSQGRPLPDLGEDFHWETELYILGLAPSDARLSIRFWEMGTIEVFAKRLSQHYQDLRLKPLPWKSAPSVGRLLLQTVPYRANTELKTKDIPPQLAGELTRSILSGRRYPRSLLTNIIMRMRSDGHISGLRVALCKAVMARDLRLRDSNNQKEVPVSLDKESTDPGYRLGRLFAVLENAQRSALGDNVNATIRDRYYGAASATPASIFPVLLRNSKHHLGRLRKDKPGAAVNLEKEIGEIIDGLETNFPKSLKIESQGRFAIGYYHQNHSRFQKTDNND